jgi:hypothetical protein
MTVTGRFSIILTSLVVCICACKAGTQAPTPKANQTQSASPVITVDGPQGGRIVYGSVRGTATQPAAMAKLLKGIHNGCGEKPQIGRVFQFRGTDSVGVFFTVTDHSNGDKRMAGLVIAAPTGPGSVEAALLSDDASNFGNSVNPMLQKLFSSWHPGGARQRGTTDASAANGSSAKPSGPAILHRVTLPDRSATVAIPEGWKIIPPSGGGYMNIAGPNSEILQLFGSIMAVDPNNPTVRQLQQSTMQYGGQRYPDRQLYCPYGVDLPRAFLTVYQGSQRQQGMPVTQFNIRHTEPMPAQQGNFCAHLTGTAVLNQHSGTMEFDTQFCETDYAQGGSWMAILFTTFLPEMVADKERETVRAIEASYAVDMNVVSAQAARNAAPAIAAIHAIGEQATARMKANDAANDAQHAGYWAQQDSNARSNQGFSNYLLDQTVVQNNYSGEHGTAWNSTADALVKADPNKYSYVTTPNYIPGTDY